MQERKTVSDFVREYIEQKHNENNEYFLTATPRERNQDFLNFCTKNQDVMNYKNHRPLFFELLQSFAREKEFELPKSTGKKDTPKADKFKVTKGKQQGNVTVQPKEQRQRQPKTDGEQSQQQQGNLQVTGNQQQQQGDQKQNILHPQNCQCFDCKKKRGEVPDLEPEEAGAIIEILIDLWHARNPNVKPMTEKEVIMVGKRLKPIIEKHMGGDILMYGLAGVTVLKVLFERKGQADEGNKKQKPKREAPPPEEPDQETQNEEPQQPTKRKFFNSRKVNEIISQGEQEDE